MNDPLDLRNLPSAPPPADLWPSIEAALDKPSRRRAPRYLSMAVAASLVLAVVAAQFLDVARTPGTSKAAANPELQQARAASARLERVLRAQRDGVLDATSIESLAWMEQELGWLDVQLADRPSEAGLWRQRTNLLAEMASEYQRNNWQSDLQLASY